MKKSVFIIRHVHSNPAPRRGPKSILPALLGVMAVLVIAVTEPLPAAGDGSKGNKTYTLDMANCAGFTAADAAKILNLPASGLKTKTDKVHASLWICSFTPVKGQGVSFSVSVAKSESEAAEEMEQLRHNLEIAAETVPFKDKLPKGAYSDIMGLGDEAVWTDVNGTLTVRRGNITVQVLAPAGKTEQVKVAQAFLAKF